jgi:excisionase family DNA binding protein
MSPPGSYRMGNLTGGVDDEKGRYLSAGEAARMLHVSPKTVSRWANIGLIPCLVTLGGHRRFRVEEIDTALAIMSSGLALTATV